ncbi:MAG TPA: hypothetical protein VMH01_01460 [Puia sp.]|nr:hypothetical protein [Puia sp.]
MAVHAVLTGDIVNSTWLDKTREKELTKRLERLFAPSKFEFYRGDSFQVYINEPKEALRVSLQCRTAAISMKREGDPADFDVRISIGIGRVLSPVRTLGKAKGEAFVLSGRNFDEMVKTDVRLSIHTLHPVVNTGLEILADHINAIFKEMTSKQAEVIFELLKQETQQAISEKLRKSKSTINQFVVSGKWELIERLMDQYEKLITHLI